MWLKVHNRLKRLSVESRNNRTRRSTDSLHSNGADNSFISGELLLAELRTSAKFAYFLPILSIATAMVASR